MLGHVAVGTWSGGRFMRFGEPISDERLEALLRPGGGIRTVMTADAYGAGRGRHAARPRAGRRAARRLRARRSRRPRLLRGRARRRRRASRASPTRACAAPRLRRLPAHGDRAQPERLGADAFDVLLLHNPDRRGFESRRGVGGPAPAARRGPDRRRSAIAPGPANGFTLDVIGCFERYGELIDWAMLILGPLEPWPGELPLAAAQRNGVQRGHARRRLRRPASTTTCCPATSSRAATTAASGPTGWVEAGRAKLERLRPIAERHELTPAAARVRVEPRPPGGRVRRPDADRGARQRASRSSASARSWPPCPPSSPLSAEEVDEIRAIGDNSGSMLLKGATPDHEGDEAPDRWAVGAGEPERSPSAGASTRERDLRRLRGLSRAARAAAASVGAALQTGSAVLRRCALSRQLLVGWSSSASSGRALSSSEPPSSRPRLLRRRAAGAERVDAHRRARRSAWTAAASAWAPRSPGRRSRRAARPRT